MISQIKAIVIDDEQLARKRIVNLLNDVKEIQLIAECENGKSAIEAIINNRPDLIFLDIQMKDMSGFDVLKEIEPNIRPLTIFITAFDEFALKAFDYFAFDYLMKPFKDDRFFKSTNKVIDLFFSNNTSGMNNKINQLMTYVEKPKSNILDFKHNKLPIKSNGKIFFIDKKNIKYIQASGYYAEIYTEQKKYLLRESLNVLLKQLHMSGFIRIHRSTIINLLFLKEVVYSNYGEVDVKMTDEKLFRISKTYKKEFQKRAGI